MSPRRTPPNGLRRRTIRALRRALAVAPLALVGSTSIPVATAGPVTSAKRVVSYPVDQVWSAAIRHLRVDRAFALTDRDEDAGFILFEIPSPAAPPTGSVELIPTTDDAGRVSARVTVRVTNGPSFLPHAIAEGIAAKVREERGPPAPTEPTPPPEPPADEDPNGLPLVPPATDP